MNRQIEKRSFSHNKSVAPPSELHLRDLNCSFYFTEQKSKKIEKRNLVPLNSFREMTAVELLEEAIKLLKENKTNIKDQQKYQMVMNSFKNFKEVTNEQENKFRQRSKIIKNNIENLITSQTDFQNYLTAIKH